MAKNKNNQNLSNPKNPSSETEGRTLYYDDLHFIPTKDKNAYWAAQCLYFNKMVSTPFIDPKMVGFYRNLEAGIIDEKLYRQFVDPKMPDGSGGKAEYFKANWQTCPIYMHLEYIKEAQLEKMPFRATCKASDEFAKLKQMQENDKIIGGRYLRNYLNEINPQFGIRTLQPDEDPFAFVAGINAGSIPADMLAQASKNKTAPPANPTDIVQALKAKISTNDQLAIYNQYLHKDGVEAAIEIGIKEYMETINKFTQSILPRFIADTKNFNAHLGRCYTSTTTGRLIFEYQEPAEVRIGPCKKNDLSDNTIYLREYDISFGEFVQMAGGELSPEQLKMVFIKNRNYHNVQGYENLTTFQRNSARIRIGYHEFESQNMDVYADYVASGNKKFIKVEDDYNPSKKGTEVYNSKRVERHYNVWYKHYYIPLDQLFSVAGTTSFEEQAKYIFGFGLVQDQQRNGFDNEYAKGTFFGWRSNRFSQARIEHSIMPEIVKTWQFFQNDLSVSPSDGAIWAEDVINNMMKYIDSSPGATPAQKKMQVLKFLRQTNSAIANFTKENGTEGGIIETKTHEKVQLNSLDTAEKRLNILMTLYELIVRSLGFNQVEEGQAPPPRQAVKGIDLSMMGSSNASYYIEKAIITSRLTAAERTMNFIKAIVDEGEGSPRFEEFKNMVGEANAMAAESIKDIPLHSLYMFLENEMDDDFKQQIYQTADEMVKAQIIAPQQALFLKMIDNAKFAYAILAIEIQAGQIALQQSQEYARQQQRADELFRSNLKIAEIHAAKSDDAWIANQMQQFQQQMMQYQETIKLHGQIITKNMINDHRTQQAIIQNKLDEQNLQLQHSLDQRDARRE